MMKHQRCNTSMKMHVNLQAAGARKHEDVLKNADSRMSRRTDKSMCRHLIQVAEIQAVVL